MRAVYCKLAAATAVFAALLIGVALSLEDSSRGLSSNVLAADHITRIGSNFSSEAELVPCSFVPEEDPRSEVAPSNVGGNAAVGNPVLYLGSNDPRVRSVLQNVPTVHDTLFATAGNYGFRAFLENVVQTTGEAYPGAAVVVLALDPQAYDWCVTTLHASHTNARCLAFNCSCPYTVTSLVGANESGVEYTSCLLGIYICKLRIKRALLEHGRHLLFIDADAALRKNALDFIPKDTSNDVVGACEMCSGTCELPKKYMDKIDHPGVPVPVTRYLQVNIGLLWVNSSSTVAREALDESIRVIVDHRLDTKSIDQTVFNRRLLARKARVQCLGTSVGGLNIGSRSSKPKYFGNSWGVHAARLVSRRGFYKQAFLHVNGLWRGNASQQFLELTQLWRTSPSALKRKLTAMGEF